MSEREPTRWLEDPETEGFVRDALEAGRAETPDARQLASLAGKLGPLLGGPGGGGPPVDPSVPLKTSLLAKGAAAVAAAALVVTGGVVLWPDEPAPSPPTPTVLSAPEPTLVPTPAPAPAVPEGVDLPELEPEPAPRPRPQFEQDPAAELALIERGQRAIAGRPEEALEVASEHARRFGPNASLAQEREVIAIEALTRVGRQAAAQRRGEAFRRRWPSSVHVRRIDVILER